jgi:hypothetical protein
MPDTDASNLSDILRNPSAGYDLVANILPALGAKIEGAIVSNLALGKICINH